MVVRPEIRKLARIDVEPISLADIAKLRNAVLTLEHPSLAARLASLAGFRYVLTHALPAEATSVISKAITVRLKQQSASPLPHYPMGTATAQLVLEINSSRSGAIHKGLAALSGALGGTFGLTSFPVELPISTTLILRAVADIARTKVKISSTRRLLSRVWKCSRLAVGPRPMISATVPTLRRGRFGEDRYGSHSVHRRARSAGRGRTNRGTSGCSDRVTLWSCRFPESGRASRSSSGPWAALL